MQYLKIEKEDGVVQITIDREDKLNAMSLDVMNEFISVLDELEKDSSKVIIITGAGQKAFSAGADIEYMSKIGYALGGGCELALSCDIRFASSNAQLGQPEVTLGICPGWGGTQRLLRIVGPARAKDLIFSGRRVNAEEAMDMGLVNKVFSSEKLLSETKSYARNVAKNSNFAVGISKMLVNRGMDANLDTGLKL